MKKFSSKQFSPHSSKRVQNNNQIHKSVMDFKQIFYYLLIFEQRRHDNFTTGVINMKCAR